MRLNTTIMRITMRSMLSRKRALLLIPMPLLLIVLTVLCANSSSIATAEWVEVLIGDLGVAVVLPLTALIIGTSVLGSEIEDGTITHILAKPLPRSEIVLSKLVVAFVLHIHAAASLTIMNRRARPVAYQAKRDYQSADFASRSMRWTGGIVLLYLLFHLADLTLGLAPAAPESFEHGAVHANMIATFSRWRVVLIYVIANLALFLHLFHGIRLAASDLGITGRRWRVVFSWLAALVPLIVVAGNIIMPLSVLFGWVS